MPPDGYPIANSPEIFVGADAVDARVNVANVRLPNSVLSEAGSAGNHGGKSNDQASAHETPKCANSRPAEPARARRCSDGQSHGGCLARLRESAIGTTQKC